MQAAVTGGLGELEASGLSMHHYFDLSADDILEAGCSEEAGGLNAPLTGKQCFLNPLGEVRLTTAFHRSNLVSCAFSARW